MAYLVQRAAAYTPIESGVVKLEIRQQPHHALVTHDNKEKGRKPIDPPPIVEMHVEINHDPNEFWLVNPFLFMMASLIDTKTNQVAGGDILLGQNISSLHRLKDLDGKDGGFFVFGDISVRKTGQYKLQFHLFDYDKNSSTTQLIDSITSAEFKVCSTKDFKGLAESTALSRHFSDQGVRLRLRKEPRTLTGTKRNWNSSPPEPSTPSAHAGLYGGPVHAHNVYGMPPVKRQRSNEDYNASYPYGYQAAYGVRQPQQFATYSSDSNGQGWPTGGPDSAKAFPADASTGLMTPGTQPQTLNSWPRTGILGSTYGPNGGPVGSTAGYFGKSNPYMTPTSGVPQHGYGAHAQPPSVPSQHYAPGPNANSLRSSTSDSSSGYPAPLGLHTPTSLNDQGLTAGSAGHANGSSVYMGTDQTDSAGHHFNGRGLSLEQPVGIGAANYNMF